MKVLGIPYFLLNKWEKQWYVPTKAAKNSESVREQTKELVLTKAKDEDWEGHPKGFNIFMQWFWQSDCRGVGSGHGNNHSVIPRFHRNTKVFLLYALPLHSPPKGDLTPELSDRKVMLSYFFMCYISLIG